ncbi:hypothetical protein Pmi06nite_77800 [Planotetraspora mira]|uniref:Uncharacterized protein n=1 Tax=Planotetraspora mira TaxID=58121 RepID=A0A8J3XFB8_9ACTN|nr:hypothetical protein Pmi06nite_77800 [Planotetraspora mira]
MFGNGVEQRVLVLEEPIDGRRLHADRLRDRTGGDRACALLTQELRRALDDVRSRLSPAGAIRPHLCHVSKDNEILLSLLLTLVAFKSFQR